MGDGARKLEIIPDYFQASTSGTDSQQQLNSSTPASAVDFYLREHLLSSPSGITTPRQDPTSQLSAESSTSFMSLFCSSLGRHCLWTRRKLRQPAFMLRLFSLRGGDGEEKVEISAVELESLRSELAALEEREALLKARLEHLDEILRWARLSGYLNIRSVWSLWTTSSFSLNPSIAFTFFSMCSYIFLSQRWAALPGEPPPIDDTEVDDWIPRFVVLQGPCLFFFLSSTDLSPQDSTLLTEIVEVGSLPDIEREGEEKCHCFYILTRYGLWFECSSISKIQVDSWLTVLQEELQTGIQ